MGVTQEEFDGLKELLPGGFSAPPQTLLFYHDEAEHAVDFYWWPGLPGPPGVIAYWLSLPCLNAEHREKILKQAHKALGCHLVELEDNVGFLDGKDERK